MPPLDCYWTAGRDSNGTWIPDPTIFTQGLPSLLDYLRAKGFKARRMHEGYPARKALKGAPRPPLQIWMYTDRGTALCSDVPGTGSAGHEAGDARYFAAAGADYVKEDSCEAPTDHPTAFAGE